MTDSTLAPGASEPSGKMLLYNHPELLNAANHGALGITPLDRPFDFARSTRIIPLSVSEIPSAQKTYPVVFSEEDNPVPLAVVGIHDDQNLYVDDDGNWAQEAYLPSYLRCYPFALAKNRGDRFAIVIDRAAPMISEQPRFSFFSGSDLTSETQNCVDFCTRFEEDKERTRVFVDRLRELDLFTHQGSTQTRRGETEATPIASYVAVDAEKLTELPAETLAELSKKGYLWPIYAHLMSLENWQRLVDRKQRLSAS